MWYEINYPDGSVRKFTEHDIHWIMEGVRDYAAQKGAEITHEEEGGVCMIKIKDK